MPDGISASEPYNKGIENHLSMSLACTWYHSPLALSFLYILVIKKHLILDLFLLALPQLKWKFGERFDE